MVILRSNAMDMVEEFLPMPWSVVGGTMPMVSPEDVLQHLVQFYQVSVQDIHVLRYKPDDFLLCC
jgi:hypothetical protein